MGIRSECPADCLLLQPPIFSEFVVVLVIVQVLFFYEVQLHRIEADHLKLNTAFLTGNALAFVGIRVHVDISITLGTCSSRHFITSNKI
jgi:hypothetical protein